MSIIELTKKLTSKINNRFFSNTIFTYSKEKREMIVNSFPEPKNRIERSFFQYKCQNYATPQLILWVIHLTSYPILLFFWLKTFGSQQINVERDNIAVYFSDGINTSIIPSSLKKSFSKIIVTNYCSEIKLGQDERVFLKKLFKRYPTQPFFVLKCIMKIGMYKNQILKNTPSVIIVYNEYSFTCSVLTDYCESQGVLHINVFHGEHLYNIRDAFVSFNKFYVWNENYKELFISMRAEPTQFIIEKPLSLTVKLPKSKIIYDITYYLGDESIGTLKKLREYLDILKSKGKTVCLRTHPRFGNNDFVLKYFTEYAIENPEKVDILNSFSRTKSICSLMSTALYEALCHNKNIIIDDCSNPQKYFLVKDLDFPVLKEKHQLLSQYILMEND